MPDGVTNKYKININLRFLLRHTRLPIDTNSRNMPKQASPKKQITPKKGLCSVAKERCKGKTKDGRQCSRRPSCRLGCVLYCYQHAKQYVKGKSCKDIPAKSKTDVINRTLKKYVNRWRVIPREKVTAADKKALKVAKSWLEKYRSTKSLKSSLTSHKEYIASLSQEAREALIAYTGSMYENINNKMRSGKHRPGRPGRPEPSESDKKFIKMIHLITQTVNNAPPLERAVVAWRGDRFYEGLNLKPGDYIEFMSSNFISTSINKNIAVDFAVGAPGTKLTRQEEDDSITVGCVYEIIIPPEIPGLSVASISSNKMVDEKEILLPERLKFAVISSKRELVNKENNVYLLTHRVICVGRH